METLGQLGVGGRLAPGARRLYSRATEKGSSRKLGSVLRASRKLARRGSLYPGLGVGP
jgi:hypothetical protein